MEMLEGHGFQLVKDTVRFVFLVQRPYALLMH